MGQYHVKLRRPSSSSSHSTLLPQRRPIASSSPPDQDQNSLQRINFYTNSNVLRYAELPLVPFSLRQLIFFGKILNRHGSNRDDLNHSLLQGANFTRVQLPIRLAKQIREFQSLPYIVTSNRYLTETYKIYVEAFEKIRTYPEIRCGTDNRNWCKFLEGLLDEHKVVIPKLAIGVAESASHLTNSQVEQFMTRMLHSRISRRVLAEHHIALTRQFQDYSPADPSKVNSKQYMRYLGVIDTELEVGKVVENCIQLAKTTLISSANTVSSTSSFSPLSLRVIIRGEKNAKFAYIPDHLEFVLFELLLNAFRATMERAAKENQDPTNFPIEVQIASSATHITIRISDQAGGINDCSQSSYRLSFGLEDEDESFPFTVSRRELFSFVNLLKTNNSDSNHNLIHLISSKVGMEGKIREQIPPEAFSSSNPHIQSSSVNYRSEEIQEARLRIGLPLSSIYAQFFGGSLEMNSIPGYSDIVLCIPRLGTTAEST